MSDTVRRALQTRRDAIRKEIEEVTRQVQDDKDYLAKLRREREQIDRKLREPIPAPGKRANGTDPLVVSASVLSDIIEEWIAMKGDGALTILSQRSGVNSRNIRYIRRKRQSVVTLYIADKLLSAMGLQNELGNRLKIVTNPRLTKALTEQAKQTVRLEELTGY